MEIPTNNVAALALAQAARTPDRVALVLPRTWDAERVTDEEVVTFAELDERVRRFATGLAASGLRPGDRVLVLFPVCADFFALVLALVASGMVTVMIDGGMDRARILRAVKDARARAIVSVDAVLKHRLVLPALWRMRKYSVDSRRLFVRSIDALRGAADPAFAAIARKTDDPALITFTSGTSGAPKGADRTHGLLMAQHHAFESHLPLRADDVDMPCFPVLTLHNLCLGVTTVMPAVDLRAPASVQPEAVLSQMAAWRVSSLDAAPAFLEKLAAHVAASGKPAPPLRRVIVGGAPVPLRLCRRVLALWPKADARVVYGSTEAEPIGGVHMAEAVEARGEGFLVGRPAEETEVELVRLPEPVPALDARGVEPFRVPAGEPGEVIVRGAHVNRRYVNNPEADRAHKIPCADGGVWHRTGDVARLDKQGRLWLLGRLPDEVTHRGRVLHPFVVEAALGARDGLRGAVVSHAGAPEGELAFAIAADGSAETAQSAVAEVLASLELSSLPSRRVVEIPMDARHNSKVDRHALRALLERP